MRRALPIIVPLLLVAAIVLVIAAPGRPSRLLARRLPAPQSSILPSPVEGGTAFQRIANSGRVEKGVNYRYTLYTHCGLDGAVDFDGSLWDYTGSGTPDDGSGNPPPGFDNPFDYGTMRLVSDDVAEYRSSKGPVVRYARRSGPKQVPMCM